MIEYRGGGRARDMRNIIQKNGKKLRKIMVKIGKNKITN